MHSLPCSFVVPTRWLEDVPVAERAIKIWPNIKTYISTEEKLSKSQQLKYQLYINLTEYSQDQLVQAKLHFFIIITKILVPFLDRFQTDKPLPLGVWERLRFVIVALPGLFSYLF